VPIINIDDIERGIRLIEVATASPLVRGALTALLPKFGLTPEQIAALDQRHLDYLTREQRARTRAEGGA